MLQLTQTAKAGTFTIYTVEGAKITVRDAEGVPFLPEGAAIHLTGEGEIERIHLIGHAPLSKSRQVYCQDFTREDVTTAYNGDDAAREMELGLVTDILMASLRADGLVVDSIPSHLI
jgi:hypothetical protein